jgi:hypothetical protein
MVPLTEVPFTEDPFTEAVPLTTWPLVSSSAEGHIFSKVVEAIGR